MAWRELCLGLAAFAFVTMVVQDALADDLGNGGRAKFEAFGMVDEYMMLDDAMAHDFDGKTIERFYPSETDAAAHFAGLLPGYCAEEGVSPAFERRVDAEGFTYFISPAIALSIRRHYEKGALKKSEFTNASRSDLRRYILGAYVRYNYEKAAIIEAANSPYKVQNLARILSTLGCSDVRSYTYDAVPTLNVLIFSPTQSLRQYLGIQKEMSFDELNKGFSGALKLHEKFDSN